MLFGNTHAMKLKNNIKELLEESGRTSIQLFKHLREQGIEISKQSVSYYVNNKYQPSDETVAQGIAGFFGKEVEEIFFPQYS